MTFAEILSISREENDESNIDDLIINTVQKEDFVFKCYEAVEVVELTTLILETIKKNSIYAVVVQVITTTKNQTNFSFAIVFSIYRTTLIPKIRTLI